jgi:hypothetical protein
MRITYLAIATLAATAFAAAPAAAASPGDHISDCARVSLGQRPNPPAVTCEHDGMTETFANFGQMVVHHLQSHDPPGG